MFRNANLSKRHKLGNSMRIAAFCGLTLTAQIFVSTVAHASSIDQDTSWLMLEASVNSTRSGLLITLVKDASGQFSGKAGELRSLRIKVDAAIPDDALVPLSTLSGVEVLYNEQHQSVDFQVPDDLLTPYVIGLGGSRRVTDLSLIHPTPGLILNYGLYGAQGSGVESYVSGNVEAIAMTNFGNFSTTGLYNSQRNYGEDTSTVRLDSTWRYVDPVAVRSYALGDFNSGALGWSGSLRMAGFQVQSAFRQRSDLVSSALPQFSGSAALPSTLDMYVNNLKVFTGEVPAGPFELQALPYVSGGDVRMVTTDATGRQVEVTESYYYAPGILTKGLSEYSLDMGVPRRNYGIASSDYDSNFVGSAAGRYGLLHGTTIEGNIQGSSDGLRLGGLGLVQSLGGFGALSLAGSASNYNSETGSRYKGQLDFNIAGIRGFAGTERTSEDFFDLSRVSLYRDSLRRNNRNEDNPFHEWLDLTARATRIDRFGLSFQPWLDKTSVNLSYNRIESPTNLIRTTNVSLSRRLSNNVFAYVTAFKDMENSSNYGVFATLSISLGKNTNASLGFERSGGRNAFASRLTGTHGNGEGSTTWTISDKEYSRGDAWRSASVGHRASFANLRANVDDTGGRTRVSGSIDGSIVAAGGDVFAANRIGDAFAIVRNAGPGSEVRQGGARIGTANSKGNALLPQLQPYTETTITIDPRDLPIGWEPEATRRVVAAGYKQGAIVDFGAKPVNGAVVVIHDAQGEPIPVGHRARLKGSDDVAIVGYDGEVYVKGLEAENSVTVDLGANGSCTVTFAYKASDTSLPKLGPFSCQ